MYKFLIFDADHTLFDFDKAEKIALEKVMMDFKITQESSLLLLYKEINHELWSLYEKNRITQEKIKFERFKIFFEKINCTADYRLGAENYLVYLSQGTYLLDGALELITKLKKHFKLGMLTNGISSVQHPRLKLSLLDGIFDAVVVSGDEGISKPNPEIFRILCEKAAFFDKSQMIMIGDSLTSDMKGGINFGIDTCWYNPSNKANNTNIKPKYIISDLDQILSLVNEGKI